MPSFCKVNKRPAEPVWVDGEYLPLAETEYGRQYIERVKGIVRAADVLGSLADDDYRGVNTKYIHDILGEDADRELTLIALGDAYEAGTIPERYSYRQPKVTIIPPDQWPDTITFGYQPHKWVPTTTLTGKRDRI